MGVNVHWESINRAWEDDPVEFSFEFQPSTTRPQPPDLDPLLACSDLIEELNDEAEDRWEDDAPFVEDTADTATGGVIALMNTAGDGNEIRTWFAQYAQRLTDQGWTGQIRGTNNLRLPTWTSSTEHLGHAVGLFVRLTPQPWDGSQPFGTDTAVHDRSALVQIANLVNAHLPTSQTYIGRGIFKTETHETPPGDAWMRAAERDQYTFLDWVDEPTRSAAEVSLIPGARVAFTLASATEPWESRLDTLTEVLTRLGPRLEYGVVRTCGSLSIPSESPTELRPGESVFTDDLDIARQYVLDAAGTQVLTGTHLAQTRDLSTWTITDLGNDRHLVQHPDPAAWYANEQPDPETQATARRDFGELILTRETYETLRGSTRS